ncbi:MAG: SEC-C metal-binding domain-containing protein [Thermomicrobiales bacterium]
MTKVGRNAPCPCGSGKKYKHCCLPKEEHHPVVQSDQEPAFPLSLDPRARERDERTVMQLAGREKFKTDEQYQAFLDFLWSSPVLPAAVPPDTPLDRAQDKVYDAFGAVGDQRATLAHEALAISPDCADAYVLLAEETDVAEKALPLYEQGVVAAERPRPGFPRAVRGHILE